MLRHAVLNCAILCCVVDQAILGTPTLSELIWILSSSCLGAWFAKSWLQSKHAGRSTSPNSRPDSVPKWDEPIGGRIRTETKRTQTTRPPHDTSSNNAKPTFRERHPQHILQEEPFAADKTLARDIRDPRVFTLAPPWGVRESRAFTLVPLWGVRTHAFSRLSRSEALGTHVFSRLSRSRALGNHVFSRLSRSGALGTHVFSRVSRSGTLGTHVCFTCPSHPGGDI